MADGLLGKLRALQRQLSATVDNCDGNYALMLRIHESAADELADLLPQIIAQMEGDAKDAARYRWLRRKVCITSGGNAVAFHFVNMPRPQYIGPDSSIELDAAIDEAKERT
jgi:hypothetical protein